MNKQEANEVISKKLTQAKELVEECQNIADEVGIGFSWDLAYGMGGWYNPDTYAARTKFKEELVQKLMSEGMTMDEALNHIEVNELVEEEFGWDSSESGWQSSSASC